MPLCDGSAWLLLILGGHKGLYLFYCDDFYCDDGRDRTIERKNFLCPMYV